MLLEHKNAVVYGGGGAIGSAVAKAFAREGARVFLLCGLRPRADHDRGNPVNISSGALND